MFIFLRRRFNVLMFQMASSRLDQALEIILHGDGVERLADVQDTRSKPKVRPGVSLVDIVVKVFSEIEFDECVKCVIARVDSERVDCEG